MCVIINKISKKLKFYSVVLFFITLISFCCLLLTIKKYFFIYYYFKLSMLCLLCFYFLFLMYDLLDIKIYSGKYKTIIKNGGTIFDYCLINNLPYRLKEFWYDFNYLIKHVNLNKIVILIFSWFFCSIIYVYIIISIFITILFLICLLISSVIINENIEIKLFVREWPITNLKQILKSFLEIPLTISYFYVYIAILSYKNKYRKLHSINKLIENLLQNRLIGKSKNYIKNLLIIYKLIDLTINNSYWKKKKMNIENFKYILSLNYNSIYNNKFVETWIIIQNSRIFVENCCIDVNMLKSFKNILEINRNHWESCVKPPVMLNPAKIKVGDRYHDGWAIWNSTDNNNKSIASASILTYRNFLKTKFDEKHTIKLCSNVFDPNDIFSDPRDHRYQLCEGEGFYKEKQWIVPTFVRVDTLKSCSVSPINSIKFKEYQTKYILISSLQRIKNKILYETDMDFKKKRWDKQILTLKEDLTKEIDELEKINSEIMTYESIGYEQDIKLLTEKKSYSIKRINHMLFLSSYSNTKFVQGKKIERGEFIEVNSNKLNYYTNYYQELTDELSEKLETTILLAHPQINYITIVKEIDHAINAFKNMPLDTYLNYVYVTDGTFTETIENLE